MNLREVSGLSMGESVAMSMAKRLERISNDGKNEKNHHFHHIQLLLAEERKECLAAVLLALRFACQ